MTIGIYKHSLAHSTNPVGIVKGESIPINTADEFESKLNQSINAKIHTCQFSMSLCTCHKNNGLKFCQYFDLSDENPYS